ncbi:MAG: hypothetical protein ABI369_10395 [Acetobacteraceae bacterium]
MRVETLPGLQNVARFPVERRATLERLRAVAPDPREVGVLADTYEIAVPIDLEAETDRATAEHIANNVPAAGPERSAMLREMQGHAVRTAIGAIETAHVRANAAATAWQEAKTAGPGAGYRLLDLEERAGELSAEAADALVAAYARSVEAFGVARAVDLARRGEPWTPRDYEAETDALIAMGQARRAG